MYIYIYIYTDKPPHGSRNQDVNVCGCLPFGNVTRSQCILEPSFRPCILTMHNKHAQQACAACATNIETEKSSKTVCAACATACAACAKRIREKTKTHLDKSNKNRREHLERQLSKSTRNSILARADVTVGGRKDRLQLDLVWRHRRPIRIPTRRRKTFQNPRRAMQHMCRLYRLLRRIVLCCE